MDKIEPPYEAINNSHDIYEDEAIKDLRGFFQKNKEGVFYSRQLEIHFESTYYHWITNRALRYLVRKGFLKSETRKLSMGAKIKLLRHKSYRYYKREANRVVEIVEKYSAPKISEEIGRRAEELVLEGFTRNQFLLLNRDTIAYNGKEWSKTNHDIDFIFGRDSIVYGVEVKNTLGYGDRNEIETNLN